MWRMLWITNHVQPPHEGIEATFPVSLNITRDEASIFPYTAFYEAVNSRVDWYEPCFTGFVFKPAMEILFFQIDINNLEFRDPESGVDHNKDHLSIFIVRTFPKPVDLFQGKGDAMLRVVHRIDMYQGRLVNFADFFGDGIFVYLTEKRLDQVEAGISQRAVVQNFLQLRCLDGYKRPAM